MTKRLAEIDPDRSSRLPEPEHIQTQKENQISETSPISEHAYAHILRAISVSIRSLHTTNCVGSHLGLLHESKLFYPTERPPHKLPVQGLYYEYLGRRAGYGDDTQFAAIDPLRIPFEVARHIFDNYVTTILPRYPCFTSNELWYHFGQVYSKQQVDSSSLRGASRFVVSMVLAISSLTSRREDFSRVASMSESLHRDAMQHWAFLKQSNIRSLQGLLLLIQLGFFLPYIDNVFFLSGEAVRMAIGLGLHQEADPVQGLDPQSISVRRQIFWLV